MKNLVTKLFVAMFILASSSMFTLAHANSTASTIAPDSIYTVYASHFATHRIYLYRGHAHIYLSGNGASDLDLVVEDSNGLAVSSVSGGDDEMVHLDVSRSGYFTVRVVNHGHLHNHYRLWVE